MGESPESEKALDHQGGDTRWPDQWKQVENPFVEQGLNTFQVPCTSNSQASGNLKWLWPVPWRSGPSLKP